MQKENKPRILTRSPLAPLHRILQRVIVYEYELQVHASSGHHCQSRIVDVHISTFGTPASTDAPANREFDLTKMTV